MHARRIEAIVAGVIQRALADSSARTLVVLDDGSRVGRLSASVCVLAAGEGAVHVVAPHDDPEVQRAEARRLAARTHGLVVNPVSKTVLLMEAPPPDPLLPFGDLYASQLAALCDGDSGLSPAQRERIDALGGLERVDTALARLYDRRETAQAALRDLPAGAGGPFLEAIRAHRFARRRTGLVPKLSSRTIGIDLFD